MDKPQSQFEELFDAFNFLANPGKDVSLGDYLTVLYSEERKIFLKSKIEDSLFQSFSQRINDLLEFGNKTDSIKKHASISKLNDLPNELKYKVNDAWETSKEIYELLK